MDDDEDNNRVEKTWGDDRKMEPTPQQPLYNHVDLVGLLDIAELEKGQEVAGSRGFYLKGEGCLLNLALINYAVGSLFAKSYQPVHTPYFMRKECMAECAQLEQFDEELYKVRPREIEGGRMEGRETERCSML